MTKPEFEKLKNEGDRENPMGRASAFSILTFSWMNDILATGNKRPLENSDVYALLEEDKTQGLTNKLQETWDEELKHKPVKTGKRPRLFRALFRMFPFSSYAYVLSIYVISRSGKLLQLVFLSLLLAVLVQRSAHDFSWAYVYGAGMCLASLLQVFTHHHATYACFLVEMRWKAAMIGLILRKVK